MLSVAWMHLVNSLISLLFSQSSCSRSLLLIGKPAEVSLQEEVESDEESGLTNRFGEGAQNAKGAAWQKMRGRMGEGIKGESRLVSWAE